MGNVRLSYAKNSEGDLEIIERSDYHPFGMNFNYNHSVFDAMGSWLNYKYNGKELQETGMYDYGARFYMPDIGRWIQIDPLSEKTLQPYAYAYNNPIKFIDPTGMEGEAASSESSESGGGASEGGRDSYGNEVVRIIGNIPISAGTAAINVTHFGDGSGSVDSKKDDNPSDIIIRNSKGEIMYRILSDVNKDVYLDTNISLNNPMTIDLANYEKMGASAVGFNLEYSGTMGGGMNGGLTFVYFIAGMDKGSAYLLSYTGGNVGLEGGVGASSFYSTYSDKDLTNHNIKGFSGQSSGYGIGIGVAGVSYSWSNRANVSELWPEQKSTTTWVTRTTGVSKGGNLGAKIFWSNSTQRKKLF